jgi:DNA-binding transcriptional ArsR family regulator
MSPITTIMSPTNKNWDPSYLRLDQTRVAQLKPRRGRQPSTIRNKFIKGPLDFVWLSEARQLGVTALWVGLGLWFLRGLRRSNSFIVSNLIMHEWGVQPDAKARAIGALEKAGLITVERRGKRSPQVTLVVGDESYGGSCTTGYRSRRDAARCRSLSRFQGGSSYESAVTNL